MSQIGIEREDVDRLERLERDEIPPRAAQDQGRLVSTSHFEAPFGRFVREGAGWAWASG